MCLLLLLANIDYGIVYMWHVCLLVTRLVVFPFMLYFW